MQFNTVILAAGFGKRLVSNTSKVLVNLINKPIIIHLLDNINDVISTKNTYIIVGHKAHDVEKTVSEFYPYVNFILQKEQLGTGHAVAQTEKVINMNNEHTLILAGDVPLIDAQLIKGFYDFHITQRSDITVLTTPINDPTGYGRIIRDENRNMILSIVEEKDASEKQKEINEINSGIYLIKTSLLFKLLKEVKTDNTQNEYYLTDIIKIGKTKGLTIHPYLFKNSEILRGINSRDDLAKIANYIYQSTLNKHQSQGVTILSPATTFIEPEVEIEKDVIIEPLVHIKGKSHIKTNSIIKSFSYLTDYVSKEAEIIGPSFKKN